MLRICSRPGSQNPCQDWEHKVEFQTLVWCKQYKNKGTPGLFMAPAPPKAKPEPGAAPHPGVTLLHTVLLLSEWCRGVIFLAEPCCSACPVVPWHKAAAPLTWQSLHPAVLLLCLTVHLGRCWGEAGKACVAQVLGRQDRNRRRVRNKSLLGQRNSLYCLGRGDTSDCLANVIQLSPGLAMQLNARLWQEDDEERRKYPEEWDLIKKKKKIDTALQSARYLVFKHLSIISESKVTCSSYCNEL